MDGIFILKRGANTLQCQVRKILFFGGKTLFIVGYLRDIPIIVTDGNPQGNNLHHLVPPFMEASVAAREGLEVASAAR